MQFNGPKRESEALAFMPIIGLINCRGADRSRIFDADGRIARRKQRTVATHSLLIVRDVMKTRT